VNDNGDGPAQADEKLTLREAIRIANEDLPLSALSEAERAQVRVTPGTDRPRIMFRMPRYRTKIRIQEPLPLLECPNLVVDGLTPPPNPLPETERGNPASDSPSPFRGGGWGEGSILHDDLPPAAPQLPPSTSNGAPSPRVAITPAEESDVPYGLVVTGDGIVIRGVSLFGFRARRSGRLSLPPAEILVTDRISAVQATPFWLDENDEDSPAPRVDRLTRERTAPDGVVIERNWLGVPPMSGESDGSPAPRSAFGIVVYRSGGTTIWRNRIVDHDGTAILTGARADHLRVFENVIERNGLVGSPDAIRLEGVLADCRIEANYIRDNGGCGIYAFKPEGAVIVQGNVFGGNGKRLPGSAIVLMGNDHQVIGNRIEKGKGPGVVVAAHPKSERNLIRGNQFLGLAGLPVDLLASRNSVLEQYRSGDGTNPPATGSAWRRQAANHGIDAPRLLGVVGKWQLAPGQEPGAKSQEPPFGEVTVDGEAEPDAEIDVYRVVEENGKGTRFAPIATGTADRGGRFTIVAPGARSGDRISATATHPRFGTSEMAAEVGLR
jgi:hypothetical protein